MASDDCASRVTALGSDSRESSQERVRRGKGETRGAREEGGRDKRGRREGGEGVNQRTHDSLTLSLTVKG